MDVILPGIFALLQILVGYNLVLPFILLIMWLPSGKKTHNRGTPTSELDVAIIVTAYQHTSMLKDVVTSISKLNYNNYHTYIVADNCHDILLESGIPNLSVFRPENILASNTRSHKYAADRFIRKHDVITIIDSDNIVHRDYLKQINYDFKNGSMAVQGLRAPKNLNTPIACLDAARDIYYHFYDGKVLSEIGSSATLSGSAMAFDASLYKRFLDTVEVSGAGFDKVLQAWLVTNNYRIKFNSESIVYDEKTSKTEQLVQQRSRWINSWFKFAGFGFKILKTGVRQWDKHKILFGLVLLRPPLFIFLAISLTALAINLFFGYYTIALIWLSCFGVFIFSFILSLKIGKADKRIVRSLAKIPMFVYYQFVSLLKARNAKKLSVSTQHDHNSPKN